MQLAPKTSRRICFSESDCELAVRRLLQADLISNDIETIPFDKSRPNYPFVMTINCYSGLMPDGSIESYCFPFQQAKSAASGAPTHIDSIYRACRKINASGIRFTGQNYVYDLGWLIRYGLPVANWAYDSMILFWSKWPEMDKRLDFISSILLDDYQYWKAGRKSDDFIEYCNYGMSDTEYTLRNTVILLQMAMHDKAMRTNFFYAHTRCVSGLNMSIRGMKINPAAIEKMDAELTVEKEKAWARLRYLVADPEFNPNSPKQKDELFYGLLGARKRNAKGKFIKKTGDESTGRLALQAIRDDHPFFRRIVNATLDAIEPAKQLSNVVGIAFHNNRFYTSYDGVGTITTRFASRKSNFGFGNNAQNIRKDYRIFMESDPDCILLDIDFSGADDYFVGFESREPKKIELLRSGRDIHCTNATIFFPNWSYESLVEGKKQGDKKVVHPITGIRQITKKLCHGISYLMAGITLLMTAGREAIVAAAIELGYTDAGYWNQKQLVNFCTMLEIRFRNHYPRLKREGVGSWYMELRKELIDTGGITTIFNYYEKFLGSPHEDSTLRGAAATAGQANTAGRINMVMDELNFGRRILNFRDGPAPDRDDPPRMVNTETHGIDIRLQTHDSLTFNINLLHPNWQQGVRDILHVMRRPVFCKDEVFSVGIEAEVSYRWAGKEGETVSSLEDIIRWANSMPRDPELFDYMDSLSKPDLAKLKKEILSGDKNFPKLALAGNN